MARRLITYAVLALGFGLPLVAGSLPTVGAVFRIEAPENFSDLALGDSKSEVQSEISNLLAGRLKFYFPFFEWTTGSEAELPENRVEFKMVEQQGMCGAQTMLTVRAVRNSVAVEMVDVRDTLLFDACDPFIPNTKDAERNALRDEDQKALVSKLKEHIEDDSGQSVGLLNNTAVRQKIHDDLLATVPLAQSIEVEERDDGTKLLYVPLDFNDLKASIADEQCDGDLENCTLIKLNLDLPDAPTASLSLRIAGDCDGRVLCEVMGGSVPGLNIARTWWGDDIDDLIGQAQSLTFTMHKFTRAAHSCTRLAGTSHFVEP